MSDLDDLYNGLFSRRKLIERISAAGLSLPLFDLSANAQTKKGQAKKSSDDDDDLKLSPENIGGGGRVVLASPTTRRRRARTRKRDW